MDDPGDVRGRYRQLVPKTKKTVGQMLAAEGKPFDEWLSAMVSKTRAALPDVLEFTVWIAEALVWARYAKRDDDFFASATRFLASAQLADLDTASGHPDRFGSDRLRAALGGFQNWFSEFRQSLSSLKPDVLKMKALQERSLYVAQTLKGEGRLPQVGMWLFPAPFKIMAIAHQGLWGDPNLAAVLMPGGTQVERALHMLFEDRVVKLEADLLEASEGSFGDSITSVWAIQLPQKELAIAAGSSVLHINSGLHLLGQR